MSTAQERLQSGFYNSAAVSGANPGGLASGGHVQNFPAALADIGAVAQTVGAQSAAAVGAAGSAQASASSAHDDRVLAQQAAQQAGQFDPSAYVPKSGGAMTGPLTVPSVLTVKAQMPGGGEGGEICLEGATGFPDVRMDANGSTWRVFATSVWVRNLSYNGYNLSVGADVVFHGVNDGSGSGLDADLVRGLAPSVGAAANSVVARNADGSSGFKAVYLAPGGQVFFEGISAGFYEYDAGTLGFGKAIYVGQGVSASVLTERSDRRLKQDIRPLEARGRLSPVRYVLKDSGEERIGFIAQDVVEVRREAVRIGGGEDEQPILEVSPMALIAHLAAQLNALQDRLDTAGL